MGFGCCTTKKGVSTRNSLFESLNFKALDEIPEISNTSFPVLSPSAQFTSSNSTKCISSSKLEEENMESTTNLQNNQKKEHCLLQKEEGKLGKMEVMYKLADTWRLKIGISFTTYQGTTFILFSFM